MKSIRMQSNLMAFGYLDIYMYIYRYTFILYISSLKSFLITTFEESFILYVLHLPRVKGLYILSRDFLSIILGQ